MLSIVQVNKVIKEKYPLIEIVRGKEYYYVSSSDEAIRLKLAGLYTTSILVARISHLSIEKWVELVELVLSDWARNEHEREPISFN